MFRRTAALTVLIGLFLACPSFAALTEKPEDAAQIQLALKKLNVLGSALYIAAHPDDENTAMLAWLSNGRLYRAGYLAMTRGDGGQNLIGDEKGALLGLIRTQELLAARRVDGAEQYFTRAIDFGYSKGPEETLNIWGHNAILADVVRVIREFQPDVIITRFPTTGEGGHGHHTASAILAGEAFTLASDPQWFPEQLKYVGVWQPRRLFWNRFSFRPVDPNDPSLARSLRVDLGAYNPLLGRSYTEIAAESRSQHKSQGFGSAERRGTTINYFNQLTGDPATTDLFEGINTTWSRYAGGEAVGTILQQASDNFDPKDPSKSIPLLMQAYDAMTKLGATAAWRAPQNPWMPVKMRELLDVIRACAGIAIDVSAADSSINPGGELPVTVTVVNRSDYPFSLATVAGMYANPGKAPGTKLANNVPVKTEISIKVPDDMPYSQPYWLVDPPTKGAWTVTNQQLIGRAENPVQLPINIGLDDNQMHTLIYAVPVVYRWTDPVRGEQVRSVDVVPDVTENLASNVYVFPEAKPKQVTVALHDYDAAVPTNVRLVLPRGWSATPETAPVKFEKKGDEARAMFTVTPPASRSVDALRAEVELLNGKKLSPLSLGVANIEYPHIPAQLVFGDANAKLVREDIKKRGTRIGYVMGSGDDVPEALRQIGYEVTMLTDADLERGDLAKYDAVVTGVRAYNTRKVLKVAQPKLLDYVKDGGTLVVQYNTLDELLIPSPGPYPFKITHDRVTVEEAPVKFLAPDSPLLNSPNKITDDDFKDWVQERGLYFTADWDPKYTAVLSSHDPGEPDRNGGELYTRYGKGVFIYTSYAWFRQLPAGVPGAYKLFANMVSAR
jgi:LmbE family N-acetylglucosaminyl deacetylase